MAFTRKRVLVGALSVLGVFAIVRLAFGLIVAVTTPDLSEQNRRWISTLDAYEQRNAATLTYVQRLRDDDAKRRVSILVERSKSLSMSLRDERIGHSPDNAARERFAQYALLQCEIAQFADTRLQNSQPWIHASYSTRRYNEVVRDKAGPIARVMGPNALTFSPCPKFIRASVN